MKPSRFGPIGSTHCFANTGYSRQTVEWYAELAGPTHREGKIRHDWIFDVLSDLKAYALANGLPVIAAKADEALAVARAEVARAEETDRDAEDPQHLALPGRKTN